MDDERQWNFSELPLSIEDEPRQAPRVKKFGIVKFAGVLAIFILVSAVLLYFERRELSLSKNSDVVGMPQQAGERDNNETAPRVVEDESTPPIQISTLQAPFAEQEFKPLPRETVRTPQNASLTAQKTEQAPQRNVHSPKTEAAALKSDEIGAKVFLHTSKEGDRAILQEIGVALRGKGYTIPETRLSSSKTQGDVRFFFSQDRLYAEKVKSIVESELGRLGYQISLDVLERDGKRFQFAAPGKLEVWIPPLKMSR